MPEQLWPWLALCSLPLPKGLDVPPVHARALRPYPSKAMGCQSAAPSQSCPAQCAWPCFGFASSLWTCPRAWAWSRPGCHPQACPQPGRAPLHLSAPRSPHVWGELLDRDVNPERSDGKRGIVQTSISGESHIHWPGLMAKSRLPWAANTGFLPLCTALPLFVCFGTLDVPPKYGIFYIILAWQAWVMSPHALQKPARMWAPSWGGEGKRAGGQPSVSHLQIWG